MRCKTGLTIWERSFTTLTSGIAGGCTSSGIGRINGLEVIDGAGDTDRFEGGGGGGLRSEVDMSDEDVVGWRNGVVGG